MLKFKANFPTFQILKGNLMSDKTCIGLGSTGEDEEQEGKRVDQPGSHPSFEVTLWKFRFYKKNYEMLYVTVRYNVAKVKMNCSNCLTAHRRRWERAQSFNYWGICAGVDLLKLPYPPLIALFSHFLNRDQKHLQTQLTCFPFLPATIR